MSTVVLYSAGDTPPTIATGTAVTLKATVMSEHVYLLCQCGREFHASGSPANVRRARQGFEKHACPHKAKA